MFDKEHDKTMAVLIGLMIGALNKIWPWQQKYELVLGNNTKILNKPISPFDYPANPQLTLAIIFFVVGVCLVYILDKENFNPTQVNERKTSFRKGFILILKGIAMGAANKVPGVSGGIVAFVAGFCEELIYSLQKINLKAFIILIKRGWRPFYQYINGHFLVLLFSGL